jgi:1L-myo-inositol 1-phosphate cytidylyltransferase / CDP-L-myo-inositol myo-inositolphosphotransferase
MNRRIASKITPLFMRTPLTPNQITTLALLSGFIAAFWFSMGTRTDLLAGAFFLQLSFILDNCDGDIARQKSMRSEFGMWYDFVADLFVDFAIWIGLAMGAVKQGQPEWIFYFSFAACLGSFINFQRVVKERLSGKAKKASGSTAFHASIDSLSQDGDPSLFVWVMAAIGYPGYLLAGGAIYINFIWIYAALSKEKN